MLPLVADVAEERFAISISAIAVDAFGIVCHVVHVLVNLKLYRSVQRVVPLVSSRLEEQIASQSRRLTQMLWFGRDTYQQRYGVILRAPRLPPERYVPSALRANNNAFTREPWRRTLQWEW